MTEQQDPGQAVATCIARARQAQREYEQWSQRAVDEVTVACGWAIVEPARNRALSELAVADSGLGNVEDKVRKNRNKTLGLLRDLQEARSVGVVAEYPELGLVEIARPVGVVGAITPSTNPAATVANNIINALKGRNSIVIAPSPKGAATCERLLEYTHVELDRVGAPRDLVQMLPMPPSKALTAELMHQSDLVVVTGSQANVRAAYASGTPAIGVGLGNVAVIVDDTADPADAADKIARSKTFDNATSCSSENNLIVLDAVHDALLDALRAEGGAVLDASEAEQLRRTMWRNGALNREIVAQSAATICAVAGLERPELAEARFLIVAEDGAGEEHPFSGEKLSPVLALHRVADFEQAFERLCAIYAYQGAGHSVGIHTQNDEHVLRLGTEAPVCRVIVNQAHGFATGGGFDNGLPFSLSMGCGTWQGNSISDNLNYRHFLNTTRIARTIPPRQPDEESIFGDYRRTHGI